MNKHNIVNSMRFPTRSKCCLGLTRETFWWRSCLIRFKIRELHISGRTGYMIKSLKVWCSQWASPDNRSTWPPEQQSFSKRLSKRQEMVAKSHCCSQRLDRRSSTSIIRLSQSVLRRNWRRRTAPGSSCSNFSSWGSRSSWPIIKD